MSMSMIRIIGVLVTVAILAGLLTVIYRDAEWTEMYRRTMRPRSRRNQAGPVQWYLSRLEKSYRILDKPFSTSRIVVRLTMMIVILTGVGVEILHFVAPLAIVIAGVAVLVAYERWLSGRARKAEEKIVYVIFNVFLISSRDDVTVNHHPMRRNHNECTQRTFHSLGNGYHRSGDGFEYDDVYGHGRNNQQ